MNVVYFQLKILYTMDCLIPLFIQASVLDFLDLEAVANDDRSTDSEEHESDGVLYLSQVDQGHNIHRGMLSRKVKT